MKKFLLGTLAIVVLTVVVALIAPSFIDWNAYRAEIATEVRKATGRKMVIEGPIDVALLPRPTLSAAGVRLANLEGATAPDMVRLEALDVRVALLPLLSGQVVVDSIELKGADIELEALADGRVNWELGPERRAGAPAPGTSSGRGTPGGADGDAVRLNQVVISDGRVTWRDSRKGSVERIENINARFAAETLSGPFVMRGKATVHDVPLVLEARVGRIETGRATPLTAGIGLENAGVSADVKGSFLLGDVPSAKVRVEAAGDSLARAVAAVTGGPGPALLGHRFTLQADVSGDSRSVTVNDMSLVLNGTRATGGISVTLGPVPSVDAALGINTLDLDSWLSALQKPAQEPAGKPAVPSDGPRPGPAAGASASPSAGFELPEELRVAVDARIGGVTYKKGAIRDLEMQAVLERGTIQVSRVAAQLPGGSQAEITGRVTSRDGAPRFDGNVEASVADARQFMDWLEIDHAAIAPDRLHRTSFKSNLVFGGDRVELRDIDLRFDTTKVGGGVVIALRDRPGIGATILIDRLNLDNFLATEKTSGPAAPGGGDARVPAGEAGGGKGNGRGGGLTVLGGFDANIHAQADRLTYQGVTVEGMALESSLIGGDLTVKTMRVANLAGGTLDLSGTVKTLDKAPVPDLKFALKSKQPERLFALAGVEPPVAPAKLAPFSLDGQFKTGTGATRVSANLGAGQLKAAVNGTLTGLDGIPSVKLDLKADYPSFVGFVRLFDPAFTPRTAPKGAFSLAAKAETAGLDLKLTDVRATLGEAEITGKATMALAARRPKLTADFSAGTIVAEHFVPDSLGGDSDAGHAGAKKAGVPGPGPAGPSSGAPWSDEPFDLEGLRAFDADVRVRAKSLLWRAWTVDDPRIDMILADGTFDLRRVSGGTAGGTFQLSGALAAPEKRGGTAALKADLDVTRADLRKAMFNLSAVDIASGKVTFRTRFQGKGASSRALVSSLDGSGRLEAVDGAITGFDLGAVNDKLKNLNEPASFLGLLQTAMSGGSTKFSSLAGTFKIEKGVVRTDDLALKADGGTGKARLTANLPKWQIDSEAVFQLSGHSDSPPFRMQLKGPLDSPSRVFNLNELQSWLVRRGVGGLIEGLIKKRDGGAQSQPTAPAQQAPSQGQSSQGKSSQEQTSGDGQKKRPNPDEFIRGIFDLLNQEKKQP